MKAIENLKAFISQMRRGCLESKRAPFFIAREPCVHLGLSVISLIEIPLFIPFPIPLSPPSLERRSTSKEAATFATLIFSPITFVTAWIRFPIDQRGLLTTE